ncbi:MAG: hypothetical protein KJ626_09630 [Verrucomicrobia bacterium]|nr:hypothetical protein [Verrucomicrobiota bacterium]
MTIQPIELLGGESVYCINEDQLKTAFQMAHDDPDASPRIQDQIKKLETALTRNERAALAFVLIDRLLKSPADAE